MKKVLKNIGCNGVWVALGLVLCLGYMGYSSECSAGLIGYFTFDNTLNDSSGTGNHGTVASGSPIYTTDRSGNLNSAIQFDGNYIVKIGTTGRGSTSFAFGGWIQTAEAHGIDPESSSGVAGVDGQQYAFGATHAGDTGNAGAGLSIGINGISVYEHAGNYLPALAVFNPGDNTTVGTGWNHVMVVYDGEKQISIYLNGTRVHTGLKSPKTPLSPIEIGGCAYGNLKGLMDEVVIYNQPLSTSQIQALYHGGSPSNIGITILNASFEDTPYPSSPGYGDVPGWIDSGEQRGVNPCGDGSAPFLNGLTPPDGTHVGFIQRSGSFKQTVYGLTPGQQYVLEYYQDERQAVTGAVTAPSAKVDGNTVVNQMELIRTPQFRRVVSKPFTATSEQALLEISTQSIQFDNTFLLDKVSIRPVGFVVFQDNFDLRNDPTTPHVPVASYDINMGLAGRQTGVYAGTTYVESAHSGPGASGDSASQVDMSSAPDALMLRAGSGASYTGVSPNVNFTLGGLDIQKMIFEFDVDPYMPGSGTGDNWASFRFGDTAPVQYVAAAGSGFGILFRENGEFGAFDADTLVGSGTAFSGPGFHAIRIEVDTLAFNGSPATIRAYADGTLFLEYLKQSGFTSNYITLGGYSGVSADIFHGFDNLLITVQHVPEPTTLVLFGSGLLVVMALRCRRRKTYS